MRNKLIEILGIWCTRNNDSFPVESVADHLLKNSVLVPINVKDDDFEFEYGIVTYKHRFSINRSLDDYEEITLFKCIRMGIEYKYKTMACDELIAEMQIVYKDANNKLHCRCKDLHEYTFEIKHKGNMQINL